ncbi:Trp biosynthesis-associated membrane protein [Cryptosporangium sp. NPDC051539]|uniref:Trp biosynthesis-associated membrane protein n=1 Tax=Cryptosporangium sp. NPDC051539 TaxID=3363962 RepID=UPI0037A4F410
MSDPEPPEGVDAPGRAEGTRAEGTRPGRRGLAVAVAAAVLGGAAGWLATGRVWVSETVERVAPLPPHVVHTTGRDLVPWASAAAVVGIAGGLALLATRGRSRLAVATLLAVAGVGTAAGGLRGLADHDSTFVWPVLCVVGGALILASGLVSLARGRRWAAMGARYDAPAARARAHAAAGPDAPPAALWDALDRGDDPTR